MATAVFNTTDIVSPQPGTATSSLTTTLTTTGAAAAGDTAVLFFGSKGGAGDTLTVTDSKGNTWTSQTSQGQLEITANIVTSKLTTALVVGDTITITGSVTRPKRNVVVKRLVNADVVDVVATTWTDQTLPPTITVGPSTQAGDMAIACFGFLATSGAISWTGVDGGSYLSTTNGTNDRTIAWAWKSVTASGGSVTFAPTPTTAGNPSVGVAIMVKSAPDPTLRFSPTGTATTSGTVTTTGTTIVAALTKNPATQDDTKTVTLTNGSSVTVPLASNTLPAVKTGWNVELRAKYTGSSGVATVDLLEGATVRKTWTQTMTTGLATYTLTLTSGEASSVTAGTNLSLRVTVAVS